MRMKNVFLAATILLLTGSGALRTFSANQPQILMRGLEVSNIFIRGATFSWVTDLKTSSNWVEVRPAGTDSVTKYQDKYSISDYVHKVEIMDLEPDRDYLFRFGSDTWSWDNLGEWYPFRTLTLSSSQPTNPLSVWSQVLDNYGVSLSRVLVRIRAIRQGMEPSLPITIFTDTKGHLSTDISTIRSSDGSIYNVGAGDRLIIDYLVNYWSSYTDSSKVLSGESPQNLGQVSIPVYDPDRGTKGDLDGSGAINIFDLLEILKILGGQQTPKPDEPLFFAADMDSNGTVNIMDLLALLQILGSVA